MVHPFAKGWSLQPYQQVRPEPAVAIVQARRPDEAIGPPPPGDALMIAHSHLPQGI